MNTVTNDNWLKLLSYRLSQTLSMMLFHYIIFVNGYLVCIEKKNLWIFWKVRSAFLVVICWPLGSSTSIVSVMDIMKNSFICGGSGWDNTAPQTPSLTIDGQSDPKTPLNTPLLPVHLKLIITQVPSPHQSHVINHDILPSVDDEKYTMGILIRLVTIWLFLMYEYPKYVCWISTYAILSFNLHVDAICKRHQIIFNCN